MTILNDDAAGPAERVCHFCGAPLSPRAGTGRPAVYCSAACRRATEYALRRAERGVQYAERRLTDWQRAVDGVGWTAAGASPDYCRRERDWWQAERDRRAAHLRDLFAAPGG